MLMLQYLNKIVLKHFILLLDEKTKICIQGNVLLQIKGSRQLLSKHISNFVRTNDFSSW